MSALMWVRVAGRMAASVCALLREGMQSTQAKNTSGIHAATLCVQKLLESLRINQELSRPEVWEEMLMHPIMQDIMREVCWCLLSAISRLL